MSDELKLFLGTQGVVLTSLLLIFYRQGIIMEAVGTMKQHISTLFTKHDKLEEKQNEMVKK